MLRKINYLILLSCLLALAPPAWAAKRVALVVGNALYRTAPLINPVNDATDMAKVLRGLGFEVLIKTNSGKKDMLEAVRDFGNKSQGAEVALFFYAGHGMQVDGVNYLIPVGVDIEAEDEVAFEAVDANRILAKMERSSAKVNIVVLDACRDNPFRSFRSSTRGLTVVRAVRGSVLVYATAPGDVAADGTDRNSPFTTHLLDSIVTPGLRVDDVFRAVGLGVVRDTGGKQTPWMSSSLYGDYYLAGAPAQVPAPSASAANQPGLEKMLTEARHKEADKQNAALKVKAEREAARERVRVDVAKYHKLLSTPEGAALKDKAWQVIKFKHPNLTANIGEGETDALVALVVPEPGEGFVETSTGMEFIWVPGGCGVMGSPNWEPGRDDDEEPTIKVCVDGFWMGKYEVTQAQWQKLIGDNPSHFKGPDNPVAGVSWLDVQEFIKQLDAGGHGPFSLPTEAQWEYAARAGTMTAYWWGDTFDCKMSMLENNNRPPSNLCAQYVLGRGLKQDKTAPVGSFPPNPFGLHDMHGNVKEWCFDTYDEDAYKSYAGLNPVVEKRGEKLRVVRGGQYWYSRIHARSAARGAQEVDIRFTMQGFRLVRIHAPATGSKRKK